MGGLQIEAGEEPDSVGQWEEVNPSWQTRNRPQ
jgi:hypothetical protein